MKLLSRLVRIWIVGRGFTSSTPLFMSLLGGMAVVTIGAILFTVMTTLMAIGASWLAYTQLLAHGVAAAPAMVLIGAVYLSLMVIAALVVRYYWRKVAMLAQKLTRMQSPLSGAIGGTLSEVADAFMSGFNRSEKP